MNTDWAHLVQTVGQIGAQFSDPAHQAAFAAEVLADAERDGPAATLAVLQLALIRTSGLRGPS